MTDKEKIEELEKRVRDLEARPFWPPTIIIQPMRETTWPTPYYPPIQPWNPWEPTPHPFGVPWIIYNDGHTVS